MGKQEEIKRLGKSLRESDAVLKVLADGRDKILAHLNKHYEGQAFEIFDKAVEHMVALEQRVEGLEDGHEQIVEWSKAYPLDVFPEPDFKKAAELLKAGGMTLDAISASNMRHVVEGVGKIAKGALAADDDLDKLTTQQKPTEKAMEEARSSVEP